MTQVDHAKQMRSQSQAEAVDGASVEAHEDITHVAQVEGTEIKVSEHDDIEKIMNEIEELRGDMKQTVEDSDADAVGSDPSGVGSVKDAVKEVMASATDETVDTEESIKESDILFQDQSEEGEGGGLPEPTSDSDPAWLKEAYGSKTSPKDSTSKMQTSQKSTNSAREVTDQAKMTTNHEISQTGSTPMKMSGNDERGSTPEVDDEIGIENSSAEQPDQTDQQLLEELQAASGIQEDSASQMSSISMAIQGDLVLRLSHDQTGQQVSVSFVGDEIIVSMGNGIELKVPAVESALVSRSKPVQEQSGGASNRQSRAHLKVVA